MSKRASQSGTSSLKNSWRPKSLALPLILGGVTAAVILLVIPLYGAELSITAALRDRPWSGSFSSPDSLIFWSTRVPRVLLGLIVGAGLSVSGLVFQAVLRNPLAEPYILGISTGASLGRLAVSTVPALSSGWLGMIMSPALCFVGALLPLLFLEMLARRSRTPGSATLLLGGVMVNVILSAIILLATYFLDFGRVRQVQLWGMGGLDIVGYQDLAVIFPLTLLCIGLLFLQSRNLNVLSFDAVTASHLGVDVRKTVRRLLWIASLVTALVVSISGPIGFVGLVIPHLLRQLAGADHRRLLPLCAVWGGVFLVCCDFAGWRGLDILHRAGFSGVQSVEVPVGIITALIGGPLFLYLLLRGKEVSIQ